MCAPLLYFLLLFFHTDVWLDVNVELSQHSLDFYLWTWARMPNSPFLEAPSSRQLWIPHGAKKNWPQQNWKKKAMEKLQLRPILMNWHRCILEQDALPTLLRRSYETVNRGPPLRWLNGAHPNHSHSFSSCSYLLSTPADGIHVQYIPNTVRPVSHQEPGTCPVPVWNVSRGMPRRNVGLQLVNTSICTGIHPRNSSPVQSSPVQSSPVQSSPVQSNFYKPTLDGRF